METLENITYQETTYTYMTDEDGKFWYCVSGTTNGLYSESDDIGPFDTYAAAKADAAGYFDRYNEE